MAYQDSNPERRNLTVLSLCIIIFYLAGGSFLSNEVRLQVINVKFSNPQVLEIFVWVMLVWFCYRYWQLNQGEWRRLLLKDIVENKLTNKLLFRHLLSVFSLGNDYSKSYYENKHWVKISHSGPDKIVFQHIYKEENEKQNSESKEIVGFYSRFLIFLCGFWVCIRYPHTATYFVPYALFFWAVILGLTSKL